MTQEILICQDHGVRLVKTATGYAVTGVYQTGKHMQPTTYKKYLFALDKYNHLAGTSYTHDDIIAMNREKIAAGILTFHKLRKPQRVQTSQ